MLRERLAVTLLLVPPALWVIGSGGWLYLAGVSLLLGTAAAGYGLLFRRGGGRAAPGVLGGGGWWVVLTLPTVWLADSGAYFVGRAVGRRKLSPRLSPNKTWEGYLAGGVTGALSGAGLGLGG